MFNYLRASGDHNQVCFQIHF